MQNLVEASEKEECTTKLHRYAIKELKVVTNEHHHDYRLTRLITNGDEQPVPAPSGTITKTASSVLHKFCNIFGETENP